MDWEYHIADSTPTPHIEAFKDAMDRAADGRNPERLLGDCTHNTARLYHELQDEGFDVETVSGGLDLPGEPTPETLEELGDTGLAHWWVRVKTDWQPYVLDLAAEVPGKLGDRLILTERPSEYIPMKVGHNSHVIANYNSRPK